MLSTDEICCNCEFFDKHEPGGIHDGVCRRYPPFAGRDANFTPIATWPLVNLSSWCGEFKPKDWDAPPTR